MINIDKYNKNFEIIFNDISYLNKEIESLKSLLNKNISNKLSNTNSVQTVVKNLQLEINKTESKYIYKFNNLDSVLGINLISYSLPHPRYNIIESDLDYFIKDNYKVIKKSIKIEKGYYNLDNLLNILNNNDDLHFTLNYKQLIEVSNKVPEDTNNSAITINKHFRLDNNSFLNKLGFTKENYDFTSSLIISDTLCDLRLPNKLYMFIKNIQNNAPFGILNFNGTSSAEIRFNEPKNLDHLDIIFMSSDNTEYDFGNLNYNLSFGISILEKKMNNQISL